MFGFKKETIKQRRLMRRKKHLLQYIATLVQKKAILEIELEGLGSEIEKLHIDLKRTLERLGKNG